MLETNNVHVTETVPLITPNALKAQRPLTPSAAAHVLAGRAEIEAVIAGKDRRLLAIVGPCSIHDSAAALEYAERLMRLRERLADDLVICMRTYFEKPRTTVGWKGLINDPHLNGTHDVQAGLLAARTLLLQLAEQGMPTATEMLDPVVPQYIADLMAWAAIGARTTESQTHREMASGLSMPVGFKNGTDGGLSIAIHAMQAAQAAHSFLGIDERGQVAVIRTRGNPHCHAVLRGGRSGPNYDSAHVTDAITQLRAAKVCDRVLVDCSHANSGKDPNHQPHVVDDLCAQLKRGERGLLGVMMESHLVAGRQDLGASPESLRFGQSITDACIDFEATERALTRLAHAAAHSQRAPSIDAAVALV